MGHVVESGELVVLSWTPESERGGGRHEATCCVPGRGGADKGHHTGLRSSPPDTAQMQSGLVPSSLVALDIR